MPKKPKRIKRRKQQVPELSDQLVRFAVNKIMAAFGPKPKPMSERYKRMLPRPSH